MKHRAGSENVSDLFTKCLSSQLFFKHRETLGFEERSMPNLSEAGVTLISDDEACLDVLAVLKSRPILLVELCCSEGSALNVVTKRLGVRYVGVTQEVQSPQVFSEVKRIILDSINTLLLRESFEAFVGRVDRFRFGVVFNHIISWKIF